MIPTTKDKNGFTLLKGIMYLDQFGVHSKLHFMGREQHKSSIGGCFTLFSTLLFIVFATYFLFCFLNRQSISVIKTSRSEESQKLNLTGVPFIFRILSESAQVNLSLIQTSAVLSNLGTWSKKEESIQLEKCDINQHAGQYKDLFLEIPDLEYCWCIPQTNQIFLGKSNNFSMQSNFLTILLTTTLNNTNFIGLQLYTVDFEINHKNISNPGNPIAKFYHFLFDANQFEEYTYYYKQIIYETDYGYIFEKFLPNYYFQMRFSYSEKLAQRNGHSIGQINLVLSDKTSFFSRSFIKMQITVALIGGAFRFIMLIWRFISNTFSKVKYNEDLVNECFFKEKIYKSPERYRATSSRIISVNSFKKEISRKLNILRIHTIKQKQDPFKLSTLDYFAFSNCCQRERLQKIAKLKEKVDTMLSIEYIISKFNELEKLKYVLLDEEKVQMFKNMDYYFYENLEHSREICIDPPKNDSHLINNSSAFQNN